MAQPLTLTLVDDVGAAYADLVAQRQALLAERPGPFRLAISGASSGVAALRAIVADGRIDWRHVELFYVDERCVPPDSPDANRRGLEEVLGSRLGELAAYHPLSCAEPPEAYTEEIGDAGFDLCQLGLGPDGHTASLFPDSPALDAPPGTLVSFNHDPSGKNRYRRITLTLTALARASTIVFTVMGATKRPVLQRLLGGEALPAALVSAPEVIWLCDPEAAAGLPTTTGVAP